MRCFSPNFRNENIINKEKDYWLNSIKIDVWWNTNFRTKDDVFHRKIYIFLIHSLRCFKSRFLADPSIISMFCVRWANSKSFPTLPKIASSFCELSTDCNRFALVVRITFLKRKTQMIRFVWTTILHLTTYISFSNKVLITPLPLAIVSSCLLQ